MIIKSAFRIAAVAASLWAATGTAYANDLSFALRAYVPERCSVIDASAPRVADLTTFRVNASCNAPNFRVRVAGDLANYAIAHATTPSSASLSVLRNQLVVTPTKPGAFQFDISYDQDLSQVYTATFVIESF